MQAIPAPAPHAGPPTLVVHDAGTTRMAIDAARTARCRSLRLLSAPGAACFIGPAWWRALMSTASGLAAVAGIELHDVLDCGDAAGRALEALRLGQRVLVLEPTTQWNAVRDRAAAIGAVLLPERPPALDLSRPDAGRLLFSWLSPAAASDDSDTPPG